nr:MAG TPA: hypothetical protein [Caudoviricetes sp.]
MRMITHETSLHAFANLGQTPSVWSGKIIQGSKRSLKSQRRKKQ